MPLILPPSEMEEMRNALSVACQYAVRVVGGIVRDMLTSTLLDSCDLMKWTSLMITEEVVFTKMNPDMICTHVVPVLAHTSHSERNGISDGGAHISDVTMGTSPLAATGVHLPMSSSPLQHELHSDDHTTQLPHRNRGSSWDNDVPKDEHNRQSRLLYLQKNTGEVHLELALLEAGSHMSVLLR